MVAELRNEYRPDYVSPPGETLAEVLQARCMAQSELADRTGRTPKLVNEIVKGKAPITPETALQLERVLSIPASFWNNRQRRYDEFIAHEREVRGLNQKLQWAKKFLYRVMSRYRWVPDTRDRLERVKNLLNYFGVASPQLWDEHWKTVSIRCRTSDKYKPNEYNLAVWLRRGEQIASEIPCQKFDEAAFRACLTDIKSLTTLPPERFQSQVVDKCSQCGVAVAFVPELPRTASGATRWLSTNRALLQLSLKYKTDDHLWFTFFHEAAHILLHQKRKIFIEDRPWESSEESEANEFAERFLVPPEELREFVSKARFSKQRIGEFACRLGIAPGIVVGQLQKKGLIAWAHCNDLKRKLTWAMPQDES